MPKLRSACGGRGRSAVAQNGNAEFKGPWGLEEKLQVQVPVELQVQLYLYFGDVRNHLSISQGITSTGTGTGRYKYRPVPVVNRPVWWYTCSTSEGTYKYRYLYEGCMHGATGNLYGANSLLSLVVKRILR